MPFENPTISASEHASDLNQAFNRMNTDELLWHVLNDPSFGNIALVSSFGAESVVLLHLIAQIDVNTPIIFLDTEMLFPETLTYQLEVARHLGLTDIRRITPSRESVFLHDTDNLMHLADKNACCALRKEAPLKVALRDTDTWISGRKRFHGAGRFNVELFESDGDDRLKFNPLAHWTPRDIQEYITLHDLPRHPLIAKGFRSIGCAPCTTAVGKLESDRAGRWRGDEKTECGIHSNRPNGNIIVTDDGFAPDSTADTFVTFAEIERRPKTQIAPTSVDLPNSFEIEALLPWLSSISRIRIDFPVFSDGRGFSLARQLRLEGFQGRLRAKGNIIPDQYSRARKSGFDEIEIGQDRAARQTIDQWQTSSVRDGFDYQQSLYQSDL